MPAEAMAYIGVNPCGCVVAITVDRREYAKHTRKDVNGYLKSGLTVERVTVAAGVERIKNRKECCRQPAAPRQTALDLGGAP